ncbi:unnamed protein product, partial [Allacma fusca]
DPQDLTIVAGIVDLSNREDEVTIQVASAKIHESYNNPERSTCDGDGGGPLIAKDEARRPYLAGVVMAGQQSELKETTNGDVLD